MLDTSLPNPQDGPDIQSMSPHSAPRYPTATLGREQEVEQILALLDTDVRVVSLLGPGGVGKTRLAVDVMLAASGDYVHGACFVSLAAVRDSAHVPVAVAQALGVRDIGTGPLTETLATWLRPRHLLLVLDNMEQVVEAAYPWLADLLASCPRLKILVTSRIALDIAGEQRFRVPPLPVPDPHGTDRVDDYASVRLFAQRAHEVRNDFVLDDETIHAVAAICSRLDGLPLAIELAAARINVFPVEEILARLADTLSLLSGSRRDVPLRLQSLRDAIAWSYDLLSPSQQSLFRTLSVFVGGFSLDAAEFIVSCRPGLVNRQRTVDAVESLINQSLVDRFDTGPRPRYRMLETVREFGNTQLADCNELDLARDLHAAYYLQMAVAAADGMKGPEQATWTGLLEIEHGNLREAMSWLTVTGRVSEAVDLYSNVSLAMLARGRFTECRQWLDQWLATPDLGVRTHALALVADGHLKIFKDGPESPVPSLVAALDVFRELGDRQQVMRALEYLSHTMAYEGDLERARAAQEEHQALARELGDGWHQRLALFNLAWIELQAGDPRRARLASEGALAEARRAGDIWVTALAGAQLGQLMMSTDGDAGRARALLEESLMLLGKLGDTRNMPFRYLMLAEVEVASGDFERARTHLIAMRSTAQQIGMGMEEGVAQVELARIDLAHHEVGSALGNLRRALGLLQHSRYSDDVPRCLELFAELALESGDALSAARFLGASERLLRDVVPTPALPWPVDGRATLLERVRSGLDEATMEWCFAESRSWSKDDAVAAALLFEPLSAATDELREPAPLHGLSSRELEVLRLLADGHSNQQIADDLFISLRTVQNHVQHIFSKLNLSSRTQVVSYAIRNDLA